MRPLTPLHALAQRHARRYDSQSCAFCVVCLLSRVFSAAAGLLASRTDFFVALPMAVASNACCLAAAWPHEHAACQRVAQRYIRKLQCCDVSSTIQWQASHRFSSFSAGLVVSRCLRLHLPRRRPACMHAKFIQMCECTGRNFKLHG